MHQSQNQNQSQKSEEILDKLTDLQDKLDYQIAQFEQNRTKHEEHLRNVKQEVKEKEVLLKDLKAKIHLANNSVKEREEYLAEQEETINSIINKGNEKLLDLNDQIGSSELRLGDLQSEIITNDKLLTDLKYNVDIEKVSLEHDIDTLTDVKNELFVEISKLKSKLEELDKTYNNKIEELASREKRLKEKETSIDIKRETLINERLDLETEKRKFKTEKALFEM